MNKALTDWLHYDAKASHYQEFKMANMKEAVSHREAAAQGLERSDDRLR
jgi:hypothetical protein